MKNLAYVLGEIREGVGLDLCICFRGACGWMCMRSCFYFLCFCMYMHLLFFKQYGIFQ